MNNTPSLRLLEARFDLPLTYAQIPQWRGACAEWAGLQEDIFHNHLPDGKVQHRYPLVQYRCVRGKAAMFAVNEGIEAVAGLLQKGEWEIRWQGQTLRLRMEQMHMDTVRFDITPERHRYRLRRWLALNDDNYETYRSLPTFRERLALLDKTLAANLLALCGGLGWRIPRKFEVDIMEVQHIRLAEVHGIGMMMFDLDFSTDLVLPGSLGMGKSASLGYGVLHKIK